MNRKDIPWVTLIWQAHYPNGKIPQSTGPCGSFWWKDCLSLIDKFLAIFTCKAGIGNIVRLWKDEWTQDKMINKYPHLCSYAKDQEISLANAVDICAHDISTNLFHLPLSLIAA